MKISKKYFGKTTEGAEAFLFSLFNSEGLAAEITNYGGVIVSIKVPGPKDRLDDVVLGYDSLEEYLGDPYYFGALIGRYANRIENAEFTIKGIGYKLNSNFGKHHLHGGFKGFDKKIWRSEIISLEGRECLKLSYLSRDGEENYPGTLLVNVIYSVTEDNGLRMDYSAVSDRDTVINLTNHSYFNLSGHSSGDISNHELMINAGRFTVIGNEGIPTGEIRDVEGTPLDLRKMAPVGKGLSSGDEQVALANGYDHNWILEVSGKKPELAAVLYDPASGRTLEVFTTKPGIQVFTPDFSLYPGTGKAGFRYDGRNGICFEPQYFPNALKHKHFPSPILEAGREYRHTTLFKFHFA